ncbi:MAG TPA: DNA repair protein RecN [Nocardioidaceae bacterium]|nr:DNA repair protein RecN [Nocardioidaceae bacterium]
MLEEVRIRSLGVIEESVLELGPGFTAITGETGAGKTMVVTALGLLLGGRADAGAVRTGAKAARVEGLVHVGTPGPALAAAVDAAGGEIEDGRLLLARQVSAEGRSRAYTGGASVPVSTLTALADSLVAVHGQSDQHRLLQPAAQRDALDAFAGTELMAARERFARGHALLRATEAELADVTASVRERAREADLLRLGLAEVEAVDPQPGEEAALAAEEGRLGFADTLRAAAEQARETLSAEDGPDALGLVSAARRLLDGVREHDPEAAALADRLAEVSYLLSDVAADVSSYASGLETDPARLAAVSDRRSALGALTRKYGETVDEVLAWAAQSAERLLELDDTDGRIAALTSRRDLLRAELGELAGTLSRGRRQAAHELADAVTAELGALAMPHAELHVQVSVTDDERGLAVGDRCLRFSATGVDDVELLLAANRGAAPRSLGRGASGGELSRVMLAVEVALAATNPVPTFVFDEVDAGVGGKAAVELGRRLALLARHAQVLVVTHLPQVAAFADRHVVVVKSDDGTVTTSGLTDLDDAGRVRELSRMLAGLEDSSTARAHAEELLATAQRARSGPA